MGPVKPRPLLLADPSRNYFLDICVPLMFSSLRSAPRGRRIRTGRARRGWKRRLRREGPDPTAPGRPAAAPAARASSGSSRGWGRGGRPVMRSRPASRPDAHGEGVRTARRRSTRSRLQRPEGNGTPGELRGRRRPPAAQRLRERLWRPRHRPQGTTKTSRAGRRETGSAEDYGICGRTASRALP